ncbi:hypothetical protein BDL97_11G117900 [Sphagnum fallax]|nr:hypothetical protein BDL97_11G117900 [Sphagnum fallax]
MVTSLMTGLKLLILMASCVMGVQSYTSVYPISLLKRSLVHTRGGARLFWGALHIFPPPKGM